ncbi:C39 family peptidase, partial [uncultured Chloroflexus sp.]|uniref:C39 family peptidase n=1 Tax=uncultured Chloroflexus sp. TaxID=214040 RepID=UPI00260952F2
AYLPCGQQSDYVRIDHGGFSTNYYHLSGIAVANGSAVARYTYIGMIGNTANCLGGASFGAHVHFWITRGTTPVPINGIDLGGWTVSELPGDYNGCMTRIRDGYRQCTRYDSSGNVIGGYGRITNEGALGSGNIPPNPPILLSPANNETVRTASVTLRVSDGGDPDNGPRPTREFRIVIAKDDNSWRVETPWGWNNEIANWTVELPSEGTYQWWAYASDAADSSSPAGPRTLHYRRNIPPNPPNLINPAANATVNTANVTLQVTDGGDPDNWPNPTRKFRFMITKSDNSWRAESDWINSTSWTVQLPSKGVYTWQVQANDGAVTSGIAGPRTLYYAIAAPVPQPPTPPPPPNVWRVPYYSQLDPRWSGQTMRTCNLKIGPAGCALTSATMIARFYGADLTPSTMNTCLGNYACPLYWSVAASCTRGKMSWVRWSSFSYANLQAELKKGPVILELTKSTGDMHFIVVIGGSGTDPANYTVHDPGVRNGAQTTLSNVLSYWRNYGGYQPSSMRIYTGTPAPLPASVADETTESLASQSVNLESETIEPLESPPLLSGETINGAVVMYRNTSSQMVLELSAQSAAGTVSEMQVWTNTEQSTVWQPFSRYVTVPLAQTYYVRFRDTAGNTSAVISTGLPQVRNLNVFTTFIPITMR